MRLRLTTRGIERTADLNDYVSTRVHFALGRFVGKLRSVSIRLFDVNGPRGGVDKGCEIRVEIEHSQEVIVRERQSNIHAAVAFAVERTERAVERQLKSTNAKRHGAGFDR